MTIVELKSNEFGGHANQSFLGETENFIPPEGWAIIPEDLECKNFPFGEIITKENEDGIKVVSYWIPIDLPKIKEEYIPSEQELLRADIDYILMMMGEK